MDDLLCTVYFEKSLLFNRVVGTEVYTRAGVYPRQQQVRLTCATRNRCKSPAPHDNL